MIVGVRKIAGAIADLHAKFEISMDIQLIMSWICFVQHKNMVGFSFLITGSRPVESHPPQENPPLEPQLLAEELPPAEPEDAKEAATEINL